jgi:hypothetical protein
MLRYNGNCVSTVFVCGEISFLHYACRSGFRVSKCLKISGEVEKTV